MLPEEGHVQQQHFPAPSSCQAGANRPAGRRRRAQPPGRVRQAPLQDCRLKILGFRMNPRLTLNPKP